MRFGHRDAQDKFLELGRMHGFAVRRQFNRTYPTDGVWLTTADHGEEGNLPIAAIEVVVSESPKTILGSILTLEKVSPAVAIMVVHEEEIRRRLMRDGAIEHEVRACLSRICTRITEQISGSKQRFQLWPMAELRWRYERAQQVHQDLAAV